MSVDVDVTAVAVMEALGLVSFFIGSLFLRQFKRIREKQRAFEDALKKMDIGDSGDGTCYSYKWVRDNIIHRPRKLLKSTPFLMVTVTILLAVFYYCIGPQIFAQIISLGYVSLIAFVGAATLLYTDAFEAYWYTRAIRKVATEQLNRQDQSYMELAKEGLEKAIIRFFALGVAFAAVGPLIPQIVEGLSYVLVLYTGIVFHVSKISSEASKVLALIIVLVFVLGLFYLPLLVRQIISRRLRSSNAKERR